VAIAIEEVAAATLVARRHCGRCEALGAGCLGGVSSRSKAGVMLGVALGLSTVLGDKDGCMLGR
jgi:hypothetical protein